MIKIVEDLLLIIHISDNPKKHFKSLVVVESVAILGFIMLFGVFMGIVLLCLDIPNDKNLMVNIIGIFGALFFALVVPSSFVITNILNKKLGPDHSEWLYLQHKNRSLDYVIQAQPTRRDFLNGLEIIIKKNKATVSSAIDSAKTITLPESTNLKNKDFAL